MHATCVFLTLFTFLATAAAQTSSQAAAAPGQTAPAKAAPTITSVAVFPGATSNAAQAAPTASPGASTAATPALTQDYLVEIDGTGFADLDMSKVYVAVLPSNGVRTNPVPALSRSLDNTKIFAQFTAPADYALSAITLSTGSTLLPFSATTLSCDFKSKATLRPQMVPKDQAGNKYGNGVAKNFYAIQISIVNECPMAIVVPLAGIAITAEDAPTATPAAVAAQARSEASAATEPESKAAAKASEDAAKRDIKCQENSKLVAYSLDHVTSIYSADRKLTGRRAIYFNTVQALATIGSAVEPFLAHGFTQAVAILGGGFTTASKEILVDMSAEQLQNLTSQSFESTEQIASHGSLQKFVFVRRNEKCKNSTVEADLRDGKFSVGWEVSPASSQAPTTQNASAKASTTSASATTPTTTSAPPKPPTTAPAKPNSPTQPKK
jgi:hypothetical protein